MKYPEKQEGLTSIELMQHDIHLLKNEVDRLKLALIERDRILDIIRTEIDSIERKV